MTSEQDKPGISATVAFVTIACLVGLAIAGSVFIILIRPDASATFSNTIIIMIGIAISFAGTLGIIAPVARRVKTVEKQTNGTLSVLLQRNRDLVDALHQNGVPLPEEKRNEP